MALTAEQKAFREKLAAGKAKEDADQLEQPQARKPKPPPGPPSQSLEAYVDDAIFMAEFAHGQGSPNATESTKDLASQIERAESYARWRYEGFLAGEVIGL